MSLSIYYRGNTMVALLRGLRDRENQAATAATTQLWLLDRGAPLTGDGLPEWPVTMQATGGGDYEWQIPLGLDLARGSGRYRIRVRAEQDGLVLDLTESLSVMNRTA